jgi:hypothetical protein
MKVLAFPPKVLVVLGTLVAALVAVPAAAQINASQAFGLAGGHAYRNNVAYDSINQVYLVIVQRPPVTARFYDRNGAQIGQDIVISSEGGFNAWASVAFGGTSNDPVFLVTYIAAQGNNPKFGRLVRFNSGSPWVTAPSFIVDVGSEWTYAEKAQNVWTGSEFVVGSRVKNAGASFPTFQVNRFDLGGVVSGGVDLGDGADYYGAPRSRARRTARALPSDTWQVFPPATPVDRTPGCSMAQASARKADCSTCRRASRTRTRASSISRTLAVSSRSGSGAAGRDTSTPESSTRTVR